MENSLTSWLKKDSRQKPESLLPRSFFERNTLEVAPDLLGKLLVVTDRNGGSLAAGRIVETEAYRRDDPASHSARGRTPRSAIMFGEPGVAYVYFIYGMYEMLNFVTEPKDHPGAVLIRALEPVAGHALMKKRRKTARNEKDLCNGPGRLCQAMGIRRTHNGESLRGPRLWVFDDGSRSGKIVRSSRVGIRDGTELDWRFFLAGNPFVSRVPQNKSFREHRS